MADDQTTEIFIHLEYIRAGVDELKAGQAAQNGRLREAETDIAILKDRADESRKSGRNWGAGAGTVGGFVGGLVAGLFRGGGGGA